MGANAPPRPPKPRIVPHQPPPVIYKQTPLPPEPPGRPTATLPRPKPAPSLREKDRAKVLDDDLGKLILQNVESIDAIGWPSFRNKLRGRGDLRITHLAKTHPAHRLLERLQAVGAPAIMSSKPWSRRKLNRLIRRGSHKSCQEHLEFLREELLDFSRKGFWIVLPHRVVRQPVLRFGEDLTGEPVGEGQDEIREWVGGTWPGERQ